MPISIVTLFVAFGILQIILFFKLWRMTNNIRDIKDRYCPKITSGLMRKFLILGQREKAKAKDMIIDAFFSNLSTGNFDDAKKVLEQNFNRTGEKLSQNLVDLTAESYNRTVTAKNSIE